ncbi:MAG TPA: peptidase M16 [Alphaproteobacteria bacterium]|nr:peptidase M16 [Alphaproteobacteria bacterium]
MKHLFFCFVLFFALTNGAAAQRIEVVKKTPVRLPAVKEMPFRIPQVREVTASNGVKAWLIEEKSTPLIAVSVLFNGGAASDPKRLQGLTPMAAALLGEGAGRYKSEQLNQILAEKAIELDFSSGADYISADLTTLRQNRGEAFDFLRLALTKPRFDKRALKQARERLLAAVKARKGNPNNAAYERFLKLVFKNHPYSRIMPSADGVKAVTRSSLKRLVRRRFSRDNMVVGVAGNISESELKTLLEKTFSDLPEKAVLPDIPDFTPDLTARTDVLTMDAPQSAAVFGHAGIPRSDPDYYAALLVDYSFGGGGFASRLFDKVREKNGLAYNVSTFMLPLKHSPMYIGTLASDNAKIAGAIDIVKAEWAKMAQSGQTVKELKDAKTYLTGSFPLSFTSSAGLASFLAALQYNGEGIDCLQNRNALMNAVSLSDARRVAARLLAPESLFFVVVGKPANL